MVEPTGGKPWSFTEIGRVKTGRVKVKLSRQTDLKIIRRSESYPLWVMPTFIVMGCLSILDLVALVFAPLHGSVEVEMILGIILALALISMSAAVRRVAIIRARS